MRMKMLRTRLEFHLGLGIDREGKAINLVERYEIQRECVRAVSVAFGGCTAFEHLGGWVDTESAGLLTECGVTLVTYLPESVEGFGPAIGPAILRMCQTLLLLTRQTALVVCVNGGRAAEVRAE